MDKEKINRINELARKARSAGLTDAETAERDALRREYIDAVLGNLENQLEHTYIVNEQGHRRKLKRRHE